MRKILFLIKSLSVGGAERHVCQLAIAFKRKGFDILVVYLDRRNNDFDLKLRDLGINVRCLDFQAAKTKSFLLYTRTVKEFAPDIVHSHLPIANVFARLGNIFGRYRLISTYHNELARLHKISRMAEMLSFWLSDINIACSEGVANSLPWGSKIIDNGIDFSSYTVTHPSFLREELSISRSSKIFLNIANFWTKKNQFLLIEASLILFRKTMKMRI